MKLWNCLALVLVTVFIVGCAVPNGALNVPAEGDAPVVQDSPLVTVSLVTPDPENANVPEQGEDSEETLPTSDPIEAPTPEPTEEQTPEPTEIPTEPAGVRVNGVGIVGKAFSRGATVNVTALQDGYYTVTDDDGEWLVESWLVRMDGETEPKQYDAYAKGNTAVFSNPYLEGEPITTLGTNTKLTVEDAFRLLLRVTLNDGSEGYTLASGASKSRISSGSSQSSSDGQDGGDISLSAQPAGGLTVVRLGAYRYAEAEPFTPGAGTILAEGTEGYIAVFNAEDMVRVSERGEAVCTVLAGDRFGTVPIDLLFFDNPAPYEAWNGYAKNNAALHRHYRMLDEPESLRTNTSVHVVGELRDLYIVEVNGQTGYLRMSEVSRAKITGGGSSGSSGGDWTEPVL